MPRPLLHPRQQAQSEGELRAAPHVSEARRTQALSQMQRDRLLRRPRSKAYMDAIGQLDAGGHVHNQAQADAIIDVLRAEFPEIELSGILLGFVAVCYLGAPYEVHTLDFSGRIIDHYKARQTLPGGLEKARAIALRGGYAFIEVYTDCCRAVGTDGSVSVISG